MKNGLCLSVLLALGVSACGGGSGGSPSTPSGGGQPPPPAQTQAILQGDVTVAGAVDLSKTQIQASIRGISGASAVLDAQGRFILKIEPTQAARDIVIDLVGVGDSASAVMPQQIAATVPAGIVQVGVSADMSVRGAPQTFTLEQGATISSPNDVKVTVPPNAFEFADGSGAATGKAELRITEIDVRGQRLKQAQANAQGILYDASADNSNADFAPNLIGIPAKEGAEPQAIYSYGMADFFFSQDGKELQLKDGMEATIQMPLPNNKLPTEDIPIPVADASEGDTLPMWHYDTNERVWKEEGNSAVQIDTTSSTGFSAKGNVSHFSTWNLDWAVASKKIRVNIKLVDLEGNPIEDPEVKVDSYFVRTRIPPADGPGWHNETSWKDTAQMTPKKNKINVLTNHKNRAQWIKIYSHITGWTTMDVDVSKIYVNGEQVPQTFHGNYRFYNYKGPDEVTFTLPYDYIR